MKEFTNALPVPAYVDEAWQEVLRIFVTSPATAAISVNVKRFEDDEFWGVLLADVALSVSRFCILEGRPDPLEGILAALRDEIQCPSGQIKGGKGSVQ